MVYTQRGPRGLFFIAHPERSVTLVRSFFQWAIVCLSIIGCSTLATANTSVETSATEQSPRTDSKQANTVEPAPQPAATTNSDSPGNGVTTQTVPTASRQAAIQSVCRPTPFGKPREILPSQSANGVTVAIDPPTYYAIGAGSPGELLGALKRCSASQSALHGYDAATAYTMSYQFSTYTSGTTCHLGDVRVTIRIGQLLPALDASVAGQPAFQQTWTSIAPRLYAHEDEHTAINRLYAQKFHDELASTKESCSSIATRAASIAAYYTSAIQSANDNLDATTAHGTL